MRLATKIDPDDLRLCADDPEALEDEIERERSEIGDLRNALDQYSAADVSAVDDPAEPSDDDWHLDLTRLARHLNRLRDRLALKRSDPEALAAGSESLGIWTSLRRTKAMFLARLRVAELSFHVVGQQRALRQLDQLVGQSSEQSTQNRFDAYRGFALEARGRCHWLHGDATAAIDDLEAALSHRQSNGADRLADRTETMIARIQRDT